MSTRSRSGRSASLSRRSLRRGASFLEILGCTIAMVVGVVLGASYLGVDLKGVAAGALKSAEVAAPEWLADAEQQPLTLGTAEEPASDADQTPADGDAEQEANDADAEPAEPVTVESARQRRRDALGYLVPFTDEQKAVLTRAYWGDLTAILDAEQQRREASFSDAHNLQLFDYLTHRQEAHAAAADAIEKLSPDGVDPQVLSVTEVVLAWHKEGMQLFERAIQLLTAAPTAQLSGPFAQSWQSAATQHRMEERLVLDKLAAVRTFLEHELPGALTDPAATP